MAKPSGADVEGVTITHPDRVLFAEAGITKRDLAEYYRKMAGRILPHVADRPLPVLRCPEGAGKKCFFQKHVMRGMPPSIHPMKVKGSTGTSTYLSIRDAAGLVALVQFGTIELHPWGCKADGQEACERLVFDLDPGQGVAWPRVVAAAREVRERLDAAGLKSFLKTTGGKGLHVVVPLDPAVPWPVAKEFSRALASRMARAAPDRFTATLSKAARAGRIFIDYLRNQRGSTSVAPYSVRARPGAPVSMPIAWRALDGRLRPDGFKCRDALRARTDPWAAFFTTRQTIDRHTVERLAGGS